MIAPAGYISVPLLKTKLCAPQLRAGLVPRPYLLGQMRESGVRPFTLLCAPAGYGKTTLLINWIADLKKSFKPDDSIVTWVSLDGGDNDPIRFLSYLVAAFEPSCAVISAEARLMLQSTTPPALQTILAVLLNDLEKSAISIHLVLDDYQFISNKNIHESMAFFLDHIPKNVHLVIATRSDPPIPLARMRARGQMTEIRADDLRFSCEEADYLFNQIMGFGLTPEDMTRLEERTEGWIAGLQMAALALKSIPQTKHSELSLFIKNFSGSNRYILDYLVEEVLSHQPQEIQDFLLRTSILENLCGSLCAAVTGISSWKSEGEVRTSQQILEYLERSNLFLVSLDSDRQWYRYHHLFASLLRGRLSQSMEAADIQELYCRASQWCENHGLLAEAISQALASPDLTCAVEILEENVLAFFYQAEITQVHRWLKMLPEALLLQNALLCAVFAATIALQPPYPPKSLPAAEKRMQNAEQALSNDSQYHDLARAFIFKIRSYWARYRGEPAKIVLDLIAKAFALLPAGSSTSMDRNQLFIQSALQTNMGMAYWEGGDEQAAWHAFIEARRISNACQDLFNGSASVIQLVQISSLQGRLVEAASLCREALASFASQKAYLGHRTPHSSLIGIQLAEILTEQNELAEVEGLLRENIDLAKWTISHDMVLRGHLALAQLAATRGEPAAAFENLDDAEKISTVGAEWAMAQRARLWLALRSTNPEFINLARKWGQNISMVEYSEGPPQVDWTISLAVVHLHLAEAEETLSGKPKAATPKLVALLEWLERQKQTMQARGWAHWEIRLRVCECLTRQSMGDNQGALATLRHAVELAAPGGYVRTFVEEGERLQKILAVLEDDAGTLLPYLRKLQSAFPDPEGQHILPSGSSKGPVDALTAREIEILQAMAEGLSNRQIAEKFILAEGTVKFYVHAVLEKLGVHNRTQAVIEGNKQKII